MRLVVRLFVLSCFLSSIGPLTALATAQNVFGPPFHGSVLDTSAAPVAGARVVATPAGSGTKLTTTTDVRGEFTLALGSGGYDIRITAPGFVAAVEPLSARRTPGEPRTFVLEVQGPRETVDVSAPGRYQVPSISSAMKVRLCSVTRRTAVNSRSRIR